MKNNRVKKLFIFTAVCAMLLSFLALFAVPAAYAQIQPPPGPGGGIEPGQYIPEELRLRNELQEAKPNETIVKGRAAVQEVVTKACGFLDFKCWFQTFIEGVIFAIIAIPVGISEFFFDWMILINLNGSLYSSDFVRVGWGISRDVANMFFIFFVLWMALATIFQFESYSAKRLLPKLIIVALLVNFSLPIGLFVIRTTDAIAKVFYDVARTTPNKTGPEGTTGVQVTSLAQQLAVVGRKTEARQAAEFSTTADPKNTIAEVQCDQALADAQSAGVDSESQKIADAYSRCIMGNVAIEAQKRGSVWGFMGIIVAGFWKLIMAIIAIFIFFAGAIFFLVRYLYLVILLVFGPLAFLFMILPATQEHWNKWWNKLIQWSFFAPVFMFMIMLSIRLSTSFFPQNAQSFTDLASISIQYVLTMGLMVASLMVAQSMGIAMSGTVVGWGRSMARGAGRYAKGAAWGATYRGMAHAGGAYAKMALETPQARRMAATPLVRGLLRPLEAAIGAKRGVDEERAKQIAGAIRSGNPAYAAARLQGERASVQAAYLRSASKDDIQKLERGMGAQEMGGIMDQLKSIAPELGKKIGQSFKDIDLRVAAEKGVTMGTPEFERTREEYMRERSPYEMGQILTPENLGKDWVRTHLLKNAGEKEMNAIAQTGDQFRALALILKQWADNRMADATSAVGVKINATLQREIAAGTSPEEAKRIAVVSNRTELAREMGGNQNFVSWLSAAPTGIMFQQGKFLGGRGENTEKLLAQLLADKTQGGGGQPSGGTNP